MTGASGIAFPARTRWNDEGRSSLSDRVIASADSGRCATPGCSLRKFHAASLAGLMPASSFVLDAVRFVVRPAAFGAFPPALLGEQRTERGRLSRFLRLRREARRSVREWGRFSCLQCCKGGIVCFSLPLMWQFGVEKDRLFPFWLVYRVYSR